MSVDVITTPLNYFTPPLDGTRPWSNINADPTTGKRDRNYELREINTQVENLRGKEDQYTIDKNGFQFFKVPTAVTNFDDDERVQQEYYTEQAELIKKLTGASRVVMFDHTIRRRTPDDPRDDPDHRQPVYVVHVDQTPVSAEARVKRHLPSDLVEQLLSKRFQIINLWRPISHSALDNPLALCDWNSLDSSGLRRGAELEKTGDLVPTTLRYPDRDGETFSVKWSGKHAWKYLRGMEVDEGVLIKCYDSVDDGSVARLTPHTAFVDPTTPKDAPERQSIELRALVFYD